MAGKVLVLSMGLMYLCLFGSLLWSHLGASTNVYSVARWYSEGRNLTRQERQKLMQHSILRTRAESEAWLQRVRRRQRGRDGLPGRVASGCPALEKWIAEVPCRQPLPGGPTQINTGHFQRYNDSFLLPHYDTLGEWTISTGTASYWVIDVPATKQRALRCAEVWLNFSRVFDPIGSLDRALLDSVLQRTKGLALRSRIGDHTFRQYLLAVLTRQAAWLEGTKLSHTAIVGLIGGLRKSNLSQPDTIIVKSFARGLQYAFDVLLPLPITEWKFAHLSHIHREVCQLEQPQLLGVPRHGDVNVPYGLSVPNALGYEVPYLTELFEHWLGLLANRHCAHPVLFALDGFMVFYHIHPFMDCNTRVSQILMNALLLWHDVPPVQLLLFMNKVQLRRMQDEAAKGMRDRFYHTLLNQINESAEMLLQFDFIRSLPG
eukprot:EG_transcript_9133